jgi:2-C-methyl-D-erythritol 4-phosphate cytidylyltransferase
VTSNASVVVVAGGTGSRFGGPKQYSSVGGKSVLEWAIDGARSLHGPITVVVPASTEELPSSDGLTFVRGGLTRSDSVRAGLATITTRIVLIHDAARPFATPALFHRVAHAIAAGATAVIPVLPIADTVITRQGAPVDRDNLWIVQTPQGFDTEALTAAHSTRPDATDDATLLREAGHEVVTVPGDPLAAKVTERNDLELLWRLAEPTVQ